MPLIGTPLHEQLPVHPAGGAAVVVVLQSQVVVVVGAEVVVVVLVVEVVQLGCEFFTVEQFV